MVSFTCYYVALHFVEALLLKRLLACWRFPIAGDGRFRERGERDAALLSLTYMMQPHEAQHAATKPPAKDSTPARPSLATLPTAASIIR